MQSVTITTDKDNRLNFKNKLLNQIEIALTPPIPEVIPESETIEIVEKFAKGIPQRYLTNVSEDLPEYKKILEPIILDSDVPKRMAFKDKLLKKIETLPVEEVQQEVDIVGYTQRVFTPVGFDFEKVERIPVVISDVQNVSVEFTPTVEESFLPVLLLPENYKELDEQALYGVLIRNPALKHSSETANLALDILAGRTSQSVEFVIVPDPIEVYPVLKQIEVQPVDNIPMSVEPMVKSSIIEEEYVEVEQIEIDLPDDWQNVPLSVLRTDLLSAGATPEQVDAKLASMVEINHLELTKPLSKNIEKNETVVSLPNGFESWKSNVQYIYLTKELKLPPEKANGVIWKLHSV